jgi:hypothetical protein
MAASREGMGVGGSAVGATVGAKAVGDRDGTAAETCVAVRAAVGWGVSGCRDSNGVGDGDELVRILPVRKAAARAIIAIPPAAAATVCRDPFHRPRPDPG